jgi:hypothetical protein
VDFDDAPGWPTDTLNALRLGRRLVTEVGAEAGCRSFVDITPAKHDGDGAARVEGWQRSIPHRSFKVEHWEYDELRIDGWDYDIDARLVRAATADDEAELADLLATWGLLPVDFRYPWETADPR